MSRVRAPPQDALQVSRAWTTTAASISATGGSSWPVVSPQPITWHRDPGRSTRFRWGNGVGRTERVRRAGAWSWWWERPGGGDRDSERDGDRQRGRNKQGANDNDTPPSQPLPQMCPEPLHRCFPVHPPLVGLPLQPACHLEELQVVDVQLGIIEGVGHNPGDAEDLLGGLRRVQVVGPEDHPEGAEVPAEGGVGMAGGGRSTLDLQPTPWRP